jgi:dynein heavy chain, axonemal
MVSKLKDSISVWKEVVPLVQCLRNTDLKERHWVKIEAALKTPIVQAEKLDLAMLLELNVRVT